MSDVKNYGCKEYKIANRLGGKVITIYYQDYKKLLKLFPTNLRYSKSTEKIVREKLRKVRHVSFYFMDRGYIRLSGSDSRDIVSFEFLPKADEKSREIILRNFAKPIEELRNNLRGCK